MFFFNDILWYRCGRKNVFWLEVPFYFYFFPTSHKYCIMPAKAGNSGPDLAIERIMY